MARRTLFTRGRDRARRYARRMGMEAANLLLASRRPVGPPIVLLGNGRSGTSWIGRTLGLAPDVLYYREPCHPRTTHREDDTVWSRYIPPGGDDPHFRRCLQLAFDGKFLNGEDCTRDALLTRLNGTNRVLVKEVACFLSIEWVYAQWRPTTLLVVRHPCPSVQSVHRLGLVVADQQRFRRLLQDATLREQYLDPFMPHLETLRSPVECSAGIWAIKNYVALRALERHPEWTLITYEDLCAEPLPRFQALFQQLGLKWTLETEHWLRDSTTRFEKGPHSTAKISAQQIDRWREQMSVEDRDAVRRAVEPFQLPFYRSAEDW